MTETTRTDRIEKTVLLQAPRSRVWRALTDSEEFGTWFRVDLDGPFAVGHEVHGQVTYPGYEHMTMKLVVDRIEPEHLFACRWRPGDKAPGEEETTVTFRLEEAAGGTRLTVVESGFEAIPADRRAQQFRENESGWATQMENIRAHVER